jgi:hypothetical protein
MSDLIPKLKGMILSVVRWFAGVLGAVAFLAPAAHAGPPYITDDPEPVEYQHWEVYLASATQHGPDSIVGTLPHFEINYGVVPNVQLHLIVPDAFASSGGETRQYGLGDTELGVKYRFVRENDHRPQIGVFPLVELPTGNESRGLGSGHTQLFLPVWLQKSLGKWTTYGGGGYWVSPGLGNKNSWYVGDLVQYQLTKNFTPGAEIYYRTAQTTDSTGTAQINFGFVWDLTDDYHILASAGPSIRGPHGYQTYLAFQWTFGPGAAEKPPASK